MSRILTMLALFASVAPAVAWGGASLPYERLIRDFPGSIRTVVSCGRWIDGKNVGTFRVIEAFIFDASFLYVQWMTSDMTNAGSLVVRTVEVAPFNDDHSGLDIESITCSDHVPVSTVSVLSRDDNDTLRTTTIQLPNRSKDLIITEVPSNQPLHPDALTRAGERRR